MATKIYTINFNFLTHLKTMPMNKTRLLLIIIFINILSFGSQCQFLQDAMKIIDPNKGGFTENDAVGAIKEALVKGIGVSVAMVSKLNGFLLNPEIKIPFPENARTIESTLRNIGLGSKVDEMIITINRAAEDASKSAQPIFVSVITGMNISDALQIVRGENDAATKYLAKTTTPELKAKFNPVIKSSLDKVDATRLWAELITAYNQIPFVNKQNPDLAGYVTDKAINGLFTMIAKEELLIRQDPVARTTDLLKKVFGK